MGASCRGSPAKMTALPSGYESERVGQANLAGFVEDHEIVGGQGRQLIVGEDGSRRGHGGQAGTRDGIHGLLPQLGADAFELDLPSLIHLNVALLRGFGFQVGQHVDQRDVLDGEKVLAPVVVTGEKVISDSGTCPAEDSGPGLLRRHLLEYFIDGDQGLIDRAVGGGEQENAFAGVAHQKSCQECADGSGLTGARGSPQKTGAPGREFEGLLLTGSQPGQVLRMQRFGDAAVGGVDGVPPVEES